MNKNKYLMPFVLVASLFFLWGFAHSILDVLNKHFQELLVISKARSAMVQAMVYGGYFLMALPAGAIIRKWGYRAGVVTGLVLYGIGAMLFIPGASIMSFPFFLLCLFIIGCGLTCLETSANPYITVLGEAERAAQRLNLAQSLNGLGWIVGPLIGGLLILGEDSDISLPYAVVGIVVLVLAAVFSKLHLPEVENANQLYLEGVDEVNAESQSVTLKVREKKLSTIFWFGVAALFFYVAAQTGINSFFINYVTESDSSISSQTAAYLLSFGGMGLLFLGRLIGSWLMHYIRPARLLAVDATAAIVCMVLVIAGVGKVSVVALCAVYFFESIMFPTIFSLALEGIGSQQTKTASSILIMSIVGGAIAPVIMGYLGASVMSNGFVVPLLCFFAVLFYAINKMGQILRISKTKMNV